MKRLLSRQVFLLLFALILLALAANLIRTYFKSLSIFPSDHAATPASAVQVAPGFQLRLLYSAREGEGSWSAMTVDGQGRFIVSPEEVSPLLRLTVSGGKVAKVEPISQPVTAAMGLLYNEGNLYLDCAGPLGRGIYRMVDNNGAFGPPELLFPLDMSMFEHGAHGLALGPDKKLYVACGDYTAPPLNVLRRSPFRNFGEDQLLLRDEDPQGIGVGLPASAGFILRMDLDGRNCEMFAGGARNTYEIAFNADGELFGFDADAEYDFGLPWYRPIRVNHWIAGADFGYRQGTGKFPEYYEDTLPATLNAGIGSPTGVKFVPTNGAFPAFYKDACFMEDWAYGRLFAVHLTPVGASYSATLETVLRGNPLNMTALDFGADGNLYFITGGHQSESGFYRLTWTGADLPALPKASESAAISARAERRKLETLDGDKNPGAVDVLWPSLKSEDRWLRYAARTALETQDIGAWKARALGETNVLGGLTSLMALALLDEPSDEPEILNALEKFPLNGLSPEQALLKLRVLELAFIRLGKPSETAGRRIIGELGPLYPSSLMEMNHELCQLLLYLNAPGAIQKTLRLMNAGITQEEQIYYAMRLRNVTNGWTINERKDYFSWFQKDRTELAHPPEVLRYFKEAGREFWNGNRLADYLENFRNEAAQSLNLSERAALAEYLPANPKTATATVRPDKFVKNWKLDELLPHLDHANKRRSMAHGRALLLRGQCLLCHRYANEGGSFGPDLTAVGSRMSVREILESILEPSKVVVQQYRNSLLTLRNGDVVSGRVIVDDTNRVILIADPVTMDRVIVPREDIIVRIPSKVSPMPEGLLNSMTESDIWDLVAALKNGIHAAAQP